MARVGEHVITDEQFAEYLQLRSLSPRGDEAEQQALDEYLRRESLASAIESSDLVEPAAIDAEVREFRKELLISRYFDRFLRTSVTDEAVQNYYNEHSADYEEREAHVAHILVRINRRMSEEERQVARTRAQEAHSQLRTGRAFAEVAAEFSEDAVSASRGGDLGWVREGAIDARFSERAFATAVGEYTEPFETPFGFHVLRVTEAPATRRQPLSAVEGDIRYALRAATREAEVTRLLGEAPIHQREGGYEPPARTSRPTPEPAPEGSGASPAAVHAPPSEPAPSEPAPSEPAPEVPPEAPTAVETPPAPAPTTPTPPVRDEELPP